MSETENLTPAQIAARALRAEAKHERVVERLTKLLNQTEAALLQADLAIAALNDVTRTEWGVRRTWGPNAGEVALMSHAEALHCARTWPADLVKRQIHAGPWVAEPAPTSPERETHEREAGK